MNFFFYFWIFYTNLTFLKYFLILTISAKVRILSWEERIHTENFLYTQFVVKEPVKKDFEEICAEWLKRIGSSHKSLIMNLKKGFMEIWILKSKNRTKDLSQYLYLITKKFKSKKKKFLILERTFF